MRPLDIIIKKRQGGELNEAEIATMIAGCVQETIPRYQLAAWLMAIFFNGMSSAETVLLTRQMLYSGATIDLSRLQGPLIDKHSTGGVGDTVSLLLAPLVAACGVQVPMMSGRALGHTGGTLDKLESIPGYRTDIDEATFGRLIGDIGFAMCGQSARIAPADRILYALRDVTGTVESVPLITASILSKKCAEGAQGLVLDVKCGSGAFMKEIAAARELATTLVTTGSGLGLRMVALLSRMEEPLGYMVGNFLEVEEAARCLGGYRPESSLPDLSHDLMAITMALAENMVLIGGAAANRSEAQSRLQRALDSGAAWELFLRNVAAQGGDVAEMQRRFGVWRPSMQFALTSPRRGYVEAVDAYKIGMASVYLGVGRSRSEHAVLPHVGVELRAKIGSSVEAGQELCLLYADNQAALDQATEMARLAFVIGDQPASTGSAPTGPASTKSIVLETIEQA